MAHYYLLNLPAHGHINPTLPVVAELIRRGHEVTYYADEPFRARILAAGASYRPYQPALVWADPPRNLFATAALLARATEAVLPDLIEAARRERPAAIIHDSLAPWGKALAALTGSPAICSTSTFAIHAQGAIHAPRFLLQITQDALGAPGAIRAYANAQARLRRRFGLSPAPLSGAFRNEAALNIVYTSRELQPAAERLGPAWQFVGPALPAVDPATPLPARRQPGRPLIYISLGTLFNADVEFYRRCLTALGDLPVQVVISLGTRISPADLGPLPTNTVVWPSVPQLALLGHTDLFITHGGMNSVHEGLACGVPLLVVPQAADQSLVAAQVQALGAGVALDRARLTPGRLRRTALQLLSDRTYQSHSARLGRQLLASGGPARAADLIEGVSLSGAGRSHQGRAVA